MILICVLLEKNVKIEDFKNMKMQKHIQNHMVEKYLFSKKGWGLCAGEFIPKGTFIMQYIGEVVCIHSIEG